MYFHEFQGVKISALAAAVPDNHEKVMDYAGRFAKTQEFKSDIAVRKLGLLQLISASLPPKKFFGNWRLTRIQLTA